MRYMGFVQMDPNPGNPPEALMKAMDEHIQAAIASGVFLDGGGLDGGPECTEVRLAGGKVTTTDGPYAEAKEVVGGYSVLEFRSHEEAVEEARRLVELHEKHWPGWEGAVVVRRIWDAPPQG